MMQSNHSRTKMDLTIINHPINRGLGETSRDLFEKAVSLAEKDDIIIRMDADDTHSPKYIPAMLERLDFGYDVVVASRFAKGGGQKGVNLYRGMISRAANLFYENNIPQLAESVNIRVDSEPTELVS